MIPEVTPWDPFSLLGASLVGELLTDAWTTLMLGLWSGAVWVLRMVLGFMDTVLTPDVSGDGPGRGLYQFTFGLAAALAVVLSVLQIGVALFRRDGRSIGRLLVGIGQFWLVWAGGLAYATAVIAASGTLTKAAMESLLGVSTWRSWQPWEPFQLQDVTDGILATVLGMCAFFVLFAAVAFFLIMVARAAALLVLVGTSPIAAAGLVSDVGKDWFWKLCRWFHAAALTPLVVVLVLGVGMQFAAGTAAGLADGAAASVGTAFASTILIATAAFAPLALFKLLAFVDPGTASGAAARVGWSAAGGLQGLIRGRGEGGSAAASQPAPAGGSQGEAEAQTSTSGRVANALGALAPAVTALGAGHPGIRAAGLGMGAVAALSNAQQQQGSGQQGAGGQQAAGQQGGQQGGQQAAGQQGGSPSLVGRARGLVADGLGVFVAAGAQGASVGADLNNQAGVGHNGYYPDFSGTSRRNHQAQVAFAAQQQAQPPAQAGRPASTDPGTGPGSQGGDPQ